MNQRSTLLWMRCSAAQKMIIEGTSHRRSRENTSLVRKREPRIPRRLSTSALMRFLIRSVRSVRIRRILISRSDQRRTLLVMYTQEKLVALLRRA